MFQLPVTAVRLTRRWPIRLDIKSAELCVDKIRRNLITASGMEQENPRPDQAGVGVLVSPAG